MTKEEAIKIIRKYECNKEHYEACEMAIKALQAEPTQMIDKSNFSKEQYRMDTDSAWWCGYIAGKGKRAEPCADVLITYKGKPLGYSEHGFLTEYCGVNIPNDNIARFESDEYVDKRIENYDKLLKSEILDCVKEEAELRENIHREKEQAYMQGYEDASKRYRIEPVSTESSTESNHSSTESSTDCISRQTFKDVMMEEADAYCKDVENLDYRKFLFVFIANLTDRINLLPPVKPVAEIATTTEDCISRKHFDSRVRTALGMSEEELTDDFKEGILGALYALKTEPPAKPERKKGKWHLLDECANEGWYCDQCHKKVFKADFSNTMRKYKFCPNCGSRMEVETDDRS